MPGPLSGTPLGNGTDRVSASRFCTFGRRLGIAFAFLIVTCVRLTACVPPAVVALTRIV
jgi:hypothetical protein